MWAVAVGDFTGVIAIDPTTAYRLAELQFSREDEAAADTAAVTMLHEAGFSHRGLGQFLNRIATEEGAAM
ncbi:MAG: hypothetical protein MI864_04150, partial [Pseudomonadales bacterium]|nr:hypothetical protein [Pseudomonadales bacterium]